MSYMEIIGGKRLYGQVLIQGSKNAVLPILAASILHKGITRLRACPKISDVFDMISLLECMGCDIVWEQEILSIDTTKLASCSLHCMKAKKTRSSVLLLGSLLGRLGCAEISFPGGCSIGERPIDYHLAALRTMNVEVEELEGECFDEQDMSQYLRCSTKELRGSHFTLIFPSVGATENIILAAVLAKGTTVLKNAAKEPEITALADFLNKAGARILGAGSDVIVIEGVATLQDSEFEIPKDRIVAGTYLAAVAAAGGEAELIGLPKDQMGCILPLFQKMNCVLQDTSKGLVISRKDELISIGSLETKPYPGFPTDLQSQFMVLFSLAKGESRLCEKIFEDRFLVVDALCKMGAIITVEEKTAYLQGNSQLQGIRYAVPDLRGGAALVIAALAARGKTILENIFYIGRGYEDISRDIAALSGDIRVY